jgi:hypothetical protein
MIEQGTSGVIWQNPSFTATATGFEKTIKAVGNQIDCEDLLISYQAAGWRCTVVPIEGTPKSVFTATIGTLDPASPDADIVTTWELDVQWSLVDLKSSRVWIEHLQTLGWYEDAATELNLVMASADEMKTSHTQVLFASLTSDQKSWSLDFANDATQWEPAAVLRRTNVYSALTTWANDWTDVNKVWTKDQLGSPPTSVPTAIIGTLPTGSLWLMTSAGITYDSNGKITVVTHWTQGTYPSHRYTYK